MKLRTPGSEEVYAPARRLKYAALALLVGLAACAAPSQPFLDSARSMCASGNQTQCEMIPSIQAQVNYEHQQQSEKVATGILLGLGAAAAGAAAGYAATHPVYVQEPVVVVCRWNCW